MPDKTMNVRNHLQRYIMLIGDAATKNESLGKYEKMLESLNQLAEITEEYYWKNEEGKMPALKKEDITKIHHAYKEVLKNCNRMLTIPDNQLKGVNELVNELSMLLSLDEAALDVVSPDKNMTLTEILENGRAVTVDIGNQSVSTTGNQMSSRIPLHIEGSDNVIKKGFFTKNSFADPLVNRDRILAEFRQKYPDMSEIFDHIETCDRQTFGNAVMGRAEGSIKNKSDPNVAKNIAYKVWKNSLNMVNVPGTVADKYETHPQYPKMMMELTYEMEKQQGLYITYIEEELYLHTDADANIDKRNAAMSAVTSLVGKPNLLAKSETMILMQNGKAVSGTFMENAVGKDAFHLSEDDPMREYDGDVYDNHEVFADIAAMQALDYICGNIDRHEGNMFYQFGDVNGKTKLIGITGIDNDLSFGLTPATTKKNVGNVWIQPEQFGVLDAATAQRILAIEKSTLQSTLSGYRLSLKEINAAWERTAHLQEKIIEGLEHFKNKKPGEIEPGFLRIVPADEWHHYNREVLAKAGNNQFKMLGNIKELIQKHEKKEKSRELGYHREKENLENLFQMEKEVNNTKPPVPVGRILGHGTMLKAPEKHMVEPLKFVIPEDTVLDFTAGASNKRFAFSYEDEKGSLKECFFTKARTLEVYEERERFFEQYAQEHSQYAEFIDRMKAHYQRIDSSTYMDNINYVPDFEELGYDEVEAESLKKDKNVEMMTQIITGRMFGIMVELQNRIQKENRSYHERVDMRNVAMNQIGDSLGVPDLLARTVPVQIQMGENIVDGVAMERVDGVDVANYRKGDIAADITDHLFDGIGLKSVADLQILDYICMNLDRHSGNMIYKFDGLDTGNPQFIGVQGIDNDYSFIGICPPADKKLNNFSVALDQISVISEKMADKILHMKTDDITDALVGTTLNKKEIIAAQQRLTRLQEAIENKKIQVVKDEDWKDMKLKDLADYGNIFGRLTEALDKMKNAPDKVRKTVNYEKIDRVDQFDKGALDNRNIDKYMAAAKETFEQDMLEIAKSERPLNELDENDVFLETKENLKLLSKMIEKADPALIKSSKEFKAMKNQCEQAVNRVSIIEREMKEKNTTQIGAEQSQFLFENIVALRRTANAYEMYKMDSLEGREANKIENVRIEAAKTTSAIAEKLCVGFRANEKVRSLELHTNRTVNIEIKAVINDMKSPDFDKEESKQAFAKIIYLKTMIENSDKLKKSNSMASALNEKAVEKAVNVIMKSKAFDKFMSRPQEQLLSMLENKNGVPFYKQFLRDNAAVMAKASIETKKDVLKEKANIIKQDEKKDKNLDVIEEVLEEDELGGPEI